MDPPPQTPPPRTPPPPASPPPSVSATPPVVVWDHWKLGALAIFCIAALIGLSWLLTPRTEEEVPVQINSGGVTATVPPGQSAPQSPIVERLVQNSTPADGSKPRPPGQPPSAPDVDRDKRIAALQKELKELKKQRDNAGQQEEATPRRRQKQQSGRTSRAKPKPRKQQQAVQRARPRPANNQFWF